MYVFVVLDCFHNSDMCFLTSFTINLTKMKQSPYTRFIFRNVLWNARTKLHL